MFKILIPKYIPKFACVAVENDNLLLWHERMGLENKCHVLEFLKQKGINVIDKF